MNSKRMSYGALFIVAVAYTYYFTSVHLMSPEFVGSTFEMLVRGTATAPMQYRILMPFIGLYVEMLLDVVPFGAVLDRFQILQITTELDRVKAVLELTSVFCAVVGFYFCSRLVLKSVLPETMPEKVLAFYAWAALLLFLLTLPFHLLTSINQWYYPYDVPSVLFFAFGTAFVLSNRWGWFYPLFILATFNRETSCFLIVITAIIYWRNMPKKVYVQHLLAQGAIWVLIKVWLRITYHVNATDGYSTVGGVIKNSIGENFAAFGTLTPYVVFPSVYGFLWIPLIALYKKIPNEKLRTALLVIPLYHILMFIPGQILEMRIYTEMLPLVVWGTVAGFYGWSKEQLQQTAH